MKSYPNFKREIMKLFFILRGITSGLTTSKSYALFFDWFYPDKYQLVSRSMNAFIEDDEVVMAILKFLGEMVENRCSRLRFD